MISIRNAKLSDATNLAVLAESTFRDTFSEFNTAEDMDAHCRTSFSETIQASEISSPDHVTLVAEQDDKLVAYAQLRWGESPACVSADSPGEIQRLYVDRAFHGKGLAHDLMAECFKIFAERETDIAWLGVWEKNPRAIAFYKKFGFKEVGDHRFTLGSDPQRDVILVRSMRG